MSKELVVRKRMAASQIETAIKKNGSTAPAQLEHKRQKLTAVVKVLEDSVAQHLAMKADLLKSGALTETAKFEIDSATAQLYSQIAMIEGLGLITDCLSFRLPVKSKSGKRGFTRYSITGFLSEMDDNLDRIRRMMKKAMPAVQDENSKDDDDEIVEEDEEVFEGSEK